MHNRHNRLYACANCNGSMLTLQNERVGKDSVVRFHFSICEVCGRKEKRDIFEGTVTEGFPEEVMRALQKREVLDADGNLSPDVRGP